MAVAKAWNLDWLQSNSQRRYPLMDGVSAFDQTDQFQIPDDLLLDLVITTTNFGANTPSDFYISSIAAYTGGLVINVNRGSNPLGVFTLTYSTHTWGKQYQILSTETDRTGIYQIYGYVAIGGIENVQTQPAGIWYFDKTATMLQPRCVVPIRSWLRGIRVRNGGSLSRLLRDTVVLEAGSNVRLRVDTDNNTVYVDAIGSDQFLKDCQCTNLRTVGDPIRTINGIAPDGNGNFELQPGRDCLSITPSTNGLSLANTCATPCCGCSEMQVVNQSLQVMRDQYVTLQSYAQRLETTSESLRDIVLASPLYVTP